MQCLPSLWSDFKVFIEQPNHPMIEFDPAAGQQEPMLAHYLSNQVDPFKSALPVLAEGGEEERVLVVASPLSQLMDETIRLHRHTDYPTMMVIDEAQRPFFDAIRASLLQALAQVDQIQFARMDDEEEAN